MKTNPKAKSLTEIGAVARQGDTALRRVKSIPANLARSKSLPTLAFGERTGHSHTFSNGGAVAFADDEAAPLAQAVRVTSSEAALTHQEHETIVFPKGDYESLKQVEDVNGEVVRVAD